MKGSFVDLQVNGILGVNFSEASDDNAYIKACDALEARGTGAFLATLVTSSMESYRQTLPALSRFIESKANRGRMAGIHLEGPFISKEDGAVGAHAKDCVLASDIDAFDELMSLCGGHLKLITMAPEKEGAIKLTRHIAASGVKVSVGHSLASYEDAMAAFAAGATLCTHLGNAVPNMLHRHKNPVIAQLASPLKAMLIADGHHLPKEFLLLALKAKGLENCLIVSDAAPAAGLPPGVYAFFGTKARVCEDGAIRNLNAPTLAGSSAAMIDCMNFLARELGLSEEELWLLGKANPLRELGIDIKLPELVEFKDERFQLLKP